MKVSYNWLNTYFDGTLPPPKKLAEELTFHAWEIEEVIEVGGDTVLDVKVLPDKAMWALSHRGIAKDLSAILDLPLTNDPLSVVPTLEPRMKGFEVKIETKNCRRFAAALVRDVKVGPSPDWLRNALETIGQRSINNIVDASNYVMFDLGQPSHAFDATRLPGGLLVRQAVSGESLSALDVNEYSFSDEDTLISTLEGEALSIAGIKGGKDSGITDTTTDIVIEVANWDPIIIRKTASRLRLRSDASARYENGIVAAMVPYGLQAVVKLIQEVAGGTVVGYTDTTNTDPIIPDKVSVSLTKINSILGVSLTMADTSMIIDRFGWEYEVNSDSFIILPPFERTDLVIPEDVIEEIGRVYGYEHVAAITPDLVPVTEINQRFYYTEEIRDVLLAHGFSEIYTSSFRSFDKVKMANAFASDKGYLRSDLRHNMDEALTLNAPNADLLGTRQIKAFEVGTVFDEDGEHWKLAIGVRSPSGHKAKTDDPALSAVIEALGTRLGVKISTDSRDGIVEIDLGGILESLPHVTSYRNVSALNTSYKPFSNYPATSRDIAMWVPSGEREFDIENMLKDIAGDLCVRVTLFDRYEKDGKTSYAYRLVFQSKEKTLESREVDVIMNNVYQAARERGYEIR